MVKLKEKLSEAQENIEKEVVFINNSMTEKVKNIITNVIGLILLCINVYMYFWQDESLSSFLTILVVSLALFIFKGSKTSQYKQVGNAVPPLLSELLAKKI